MNNIVEFFSPAWNFFVHNLFSIAALTISVYTLWKGRKHLSFTFQKDISILPFKSIFCFDKDGNKLTYDICLMTSISIVNPSSSDIGYFDLRVFDTNTNINLNFLTSRTLPPDLDDKRVFYQATEGLRQLDIPTRNFGTFKSNSFSRMDIVIIIPDNLDTNSISIDIKYPKVQLFRSKRDPFAISNRKVFAHQGIHYSFPNGLQTDLLNSISEQSVPKEYLISMLLNQLIELAKSKL
ncbi:hypothetical protein ACI78P_01570 [Leuconostoc mesenteroides]|uniref:hypothetical protein n=1 Tax=Leuconostoc mesenteroides TaxID=1245 RepID=UPI00385F7932